MKFTTTVTLLTTFLTTLVNQVVAASSLKEREQASALAFVDTNRTSFPELDPIYLEEGLNVAFENSCETHFLFAGLDLPPAFAEMEGIQAAGGKVNAKDELERLFSEQFLQEMNVFATQSQIPMHWKETHVIQSGVVTPEDLEAIYNGNAGRRGRRQLRGGDDDDKEERRQLHYNDYWDQIYPGGIPFWLANSYANWNCGNTFSSCNPHDCNADHGGYDYSSHCRYSGGGRNLKRTTRPKQAFSTLVEDTKDGVSERLHVMPNKDFVANRLEQNEILQEKFDHQLACVIVNCGGNQVSMSDGCADLAEKRAEAYDATSVPP